MPKKDPAELPILTHSSCFAAATFSKVALSIPLADGCNLLLARIPILLEDSKDAHLTLALVTP